MSAVAGASAKRLQRIVLDGCSQRAMAVLFLCKQCLFTTSVVSIAKRIMRFLVVPSNEFKQCKAAFLLGLLPVASVTRTLAFHPAPQRQTRAKGTDGLDIAILDSSQT